jgi:DNA-directed RNA polymerase subunit M/transcription elongation factor TFIIS
VANQVTNYQCPACTGPLQFKGGTGKLECEYCGNSYDISTIEQLYVDKEKQEQVASEKAPQWDVSQGRETWTEAEKDDLCVYHCPSCGAEIVCDKTTAATSCPYCCNPTIIPGQLSGSFKPDYVIPFRLEKEAAVEALKKHCRRKVLLPKSFLSENRLEEIKSIYVPFWLFDCDAHADIVYRAQKIRYWSDGEYDVTETSHYRVARKGRVDFRGIPVDGSSKMPDAHMDAIEPFDYQNLERFTTAYLPGHLADQYDVDAEQSAQRANARIEASTESMFSSTLGEYSSHQVEYADIQIEQGNVNYALLPVWLLSTKWREKQFLFAMNGQTGKMIGDLPISRGRLAAWFFGIFVPLAAALIAAAYFWL